MKQELQLVAFTITTTINNQSLIRKIILQTHHTSSFFIKNPNPELKYNADPDVGIIIPAMLCLHLRLTFMPSTFLSSLQVICIYLYIY